MQFERQGNIGGNSAGREQVQLLKDNSHLAPLPSQLSVSQARPVAAGNPDLACVRSFQPRDAAQQRGFSSSTQAQYAVNRSGVNLQVDLIQCRRLSAGESLRQASNVDGRVTGQRYDVTLQNRLLLHSAP